MCSLGARPLRGEASSSSLHVGAVPMIKTSAPKGSHRAAGRSLATALRDRRAYVIPMQPNRSLPVRPAPLHTPSRPASVVKASLGASRSSRTVEPAIRPRAAAPDAVVSSPHLVPPAIKPVKLKKIQIKNEENCEKIVDHLEAEKSARMRRTHSQHVTTSETFIDLSRSPERIDLSDEISICPSRLDSSSPGCWVHGSVAPKDKRRRRRREKRRFSEGTEEQRPSVTSAEVGRTVPPLRLKKIQSLQEPRIVKGTGWKEIGREIPDADFREGGFFRGGQFAGFAAVGSDKYRIVTGHSPPYEDRQRIDEPDSLDAPKLRYRQTKLKLKLRELRRKTVELGKEMLRTVFTTSTGPRGSRMRQTMNRYEGQIRHLEALLNELPRVAYAEDDGRMDWGGFREAERAFGTEGCKQGEIRSPVANVCGSGSSSLSSSPSLEPPKLSPRSPTNYEAARSPSEVRNSPPVLPRVYVTIADCTGDTWDERCTRRARNKRRNRSPLAKAAESIVGPSSPVISTTTETIISKDKDELLMETETYDEKNFLEIGKTDLEILEVYEDTSENSLEKKFETAKDVKPTIKRMSSPEPVVIDTTSADTDYETKPQILRKLNASVASGRRSLDELVESRAEKEAETKEEIVTVPEDDQVVEPPVASRVTGNGIGIAEQFPTLGNWIAKLSKQQVAESACNKLTDNPRIEERPSAFQVFSPETAKPASPEVSRTTAARPPLDDPVNVAPQWRAERWQEQQDQQPHNQSLPQSHAANLPLPAPPPPPPPPPPPSLGQEFCSPIAMARLYTRNYAIDPYSVAYGYNPAIAAAAATASLWNSAAILQYPQYLQRPSSSLLSAQQPRLPPGSLQYPGGAQPVQRPNYRFSSAQPSDGKRPESLLNYTRDGKILPSGYATTFEQAKRATVDYHQSVTSGGQSRGISCNSANGPSVDYRNCPQQQQQQQPQIQEQQQQQFVRSGCYADGAMRLPTAGGATWRTLSAIGGDYNYGAAWNSAGSGNVFKAIGSLARTSSPGFVSATTRPRNPKGPGDANARNRETPHLGKVNYSSNAASNLECSNCGVAGSMFKCLGCEVAFYCDENCQTRHWSRHVISCPKKMPKLKKLVH